MMVLGGSVRGGLHGTGTDARARPPTLGTAPATFHYETDFRSVYAKIARSWLGVNSVPILNATFDRRAANFLGVTTVYRFFRRQSSS